ncbi:MAG: hypothetical protein PHAS_01296 [Phascolarctobacterium sp.]
MPNYLNAISKAGIFYLYICCPGVCRRNIYFVAISFAGQIGIHNNVATSTAKISNIYLCCSNFIKSQINCRTTIKCHFIHDICNIAFRYTPYSIICHIQHRITTVARNNKTLQQRIGPV